MDKQDAFKILNLEPGVSLEEARKAYRELAKRYHPDRAGDLPEMLKDAEFRMKEINLAYKLIAPGLKPGKKAESPFKEKPQPGFSWTSFFNNVGRRFKKSDRPQKASYYNSGKLRPKAFGRKRKRMPGDNFETVFAQSNPDFLVKNRKRTTAAARNSLGKQGNIGYENYQKYMDYKRAIKKARRLSSADTEIGRIQKIQPVPPVERIKR